MAIADGTAGAWVATTTRNPTVTLPTHAAGDMLLVRVGWKSATPTTDVAVCNTSGWAKLGQFYNGGGASSNGGGGVLVAVFWKVATSSAETNPVIEFDDATAPTPGAYCAVTYTKAATEAWATPVGDGGNIAAATSYSGTIQSHVTAQSGDMLDAFAVTNDNTTLTVPTVTQTGLTLDTVTEYPATALSSATSNDISADGCNRLATAGTSSAAAVVSGTNSVADPGAAWVTRLRVVFDFSGSTSASHASSTSSTGRKDGSGTASVSHASATSATGRKDGAGTATVAHTSSTSVTGGGSASVALTHASATSATGTTGREGTASISHASSTSATGEKGQTWDLSGSFTIDHATATAAQGAKAASGTTSATHASSSTAQGQRSAAGTASVSHTSATTATGRSDRLGVASATHASDATGTGAKGAAGSATVAHTSATAATGSAAEAHAGSFTLTLASSTSATGASARTSGASADHATGTSIVGTAGRESIAALTHAHATQASGAHASAGAVAIALAASIIVAGFAGQPITRSHVTVGDSVIGPGGRKASVGDTLVGAARLSVGGASTDGTTVGDS